MKTIAAMLEFAERNYPEVPYLMNKSDNGWQGYTFSQAAEESRILAMGLLSLGFKPGAW